MAAFPPLRDGRTGHLGGEAAQSQIAQHPRSVRSGSRWLRKVPPQLCPSLLQPIGVKVINGLIDDRTSQPMLSEFRSDSQTTVALPGSMPSQRSGKSAITEVSPIPQPLKPGLD